MSKNFFDQFVSDGGTDTAVADQPAKSKKENFFSQFVDSAPKPAESFVKNLQSGDPKKIASGAAALAELMGGMVTAGMEAKSSMDARDLEAVGRSLTQADQPSGDQSIFEQNLSPMLPKGQGMRNIGEAIKTIADVSPLKAVGLSPEGIQTAADYWTKKLPNNWQGAARIAQAPGVGTAKLVTGIADWIASPGGAAQLVAAGLPVTKIPMAAKFFNDMASGAGQSASDMIDKWESGDVQGFTDALLGTLANTAGAGMLGLHTRGSMKPEAPIPPKLSRTIKPTDLKPAIKLPSGEIHTGDDHVSAYETAKETTPDTSGSKEGFKHTDPETKKETFISREDAAQATGLPTEREPGKLHSSDLAKFQGMSPEEIEQYKKDRQEVAGSKRAERALSRKLRAGVDESKPVQTFDLDGDPATAPDPSKPVAAPKPAEAEFTPEIKKQLKPKSNWQVVVSNYDPLPDGTKIPGSVQLVDPSDIGHRGMKGGNPVVATVESVRKAGHEVPDFSKLPTGRYSWDEAVKKLSEMEKPAKGKVDADPEIEAAVKEAAPEKFKEQADKLADSLDRLKTGTDWGKGDLHLFGVVPLIWDKSIEAAQAVIRAGGSVADAVDAAIKYIKENHKGAFREADARKYLGGHLEEEAKPLKVEESQPLDPQSGTPKVEAKKPEIIGMGGAVKSGFEKGKGSPTAMKYQLIDQERQQRGVEPLAKPESVSDQALMDRAMAEIDKNPSLPDQLVAEINSRPRVIEPYERMVLLLEKISLRDAYEKSARALVQAFDHSNEHPLSKADILAHNIEIARLSDKLTELEKASRQSGSETGRALRALRIMANEDYSLASLELRRRAVKGGEPITPAERAELQKIADDYKKSNDELQQHLDRSKESELEARRQLDEILRQPKPEPVEPHVKAVADKLKGFFDTRAKSALERIKARRAEGRLFADPTSIATLGKLSTEDLVDYADYGASKVLSLGVKAGEMSAEWAKTMKDDIGDYIVPHLKQIWQASHKNLDDRINEIGANLKKVKEAAKTMSVPEKIANAKARLKTEIANGDKSSVTPVVQALARLFVQMGVKTRDELIDAVHGALKEVDPKIERRDAMDAISGYGDFRQLSKDEVSKTLRDLKRQMQEIAKLEDMAAGKPPLKTGMERSEVTKEQSRLIKLVNEAKFKFQVPIGDPATQLKSALDEFKKRTQSSIDDYQRRLDEGDFAKKPRRKLGLDRKALELLARKEAVAKKFRGEQEKWRQAQKPKIEGWLDWVSNLRRFSVLSGVHVLGKLSAYSATKLPTMGATEAIGGVISALPKVSDVAKMAPSEGGSNLRSLATATAKGLTQGFVDAYQVATKGSSDLKQALSPRIDTGFHWYYIPQLIHEIIKSPLRRTAFEHSLAKRMEHAARNGADITDPLTQIALAKDAYLDSDRALLLENNRFARSISALFKSWERPDPKTGKVPFMGKVGATVGRVELPILAVPFNYVKQTLVHVFGTISGGAMLIDAYRRGIDTLKPEEADAIVRHLKNGSIGFAVLLYGFFDGYNNVNDPSKSTFGGFYQPGEKRKKDQATAGGLKIMGYKIPGFLTHNPIIAVGQLGHTIGAIAASKISKHNHDTRGITAGTAAGLFGLLNDSPVGRTTELVSTLGDPRSFDYAFGEHLKGLLIPQLMNEAAQWTDKDAQGNVIKRDPKTIPQHIETGIPGLRQNVPKKKVF